MKKLLSIILLIVLMFTSVSATSVSNIDFDTETSWWWLQNNLTTTWSSDGLYDFASYGQESVNIPLMNYLNGSDSFTSISGHTINSTGLTLNDGTLHITEYCFQESATSSTACGGLATGNYQREDHEPHFYINYTKPINSTSAIWSVKHGTQGLYNITIPQSCFNYDTNNLILRFWNPAKENSQPQCHSSTGWEGIGVNETSGGVASITTFGTNEGYDNNYGTYFFYNVPHATNDWRASTSTPLGGQIYEESVYWNVKTDYNSFDGVDDYIDTNLNIDNSSFSISGVFRPFNERTTTLYIVNNYVANTKGFRISTYSGNLYFAISDGSQREISCINGAEKDSMHHFTATYNDSTMKLYLNGTLCSSLDSVYMIDSSNNIFIGSYANFPANYFNGSIENIRVWNKTLNQTQITDNLNTAQPVEGDELMLSYTFDDYTATHVRDSHYLVGRKVNNELISPAYNFNEDHYLTYNRTGNFSKQTVSLWYKLNQPAAGNMYSGDGSWNGESIVQFGNGYVKQRLKINGVVREKQCTYTSDNDWHHYAYTFGDDDKTWRIYIDGEEFCNYLYTGDTTQADYTINPTSYIGYTTGFGGIYFDGAISNFRLYPVSLTPNSISELYDKERTGFSSKEFTLTNDYHLDNDTINFSVYTNDLFNWYSAYDTITSSDTYKYINFTTYAASNNSIIRNNITLLIKGDVHTWYETLINGMGIVEFNNTGTYEIDISTGGYTEADYLLTIANQTNETIKLYLQSADDNVTFNYKDKNFGTALEGVSVVMKMYNPITSTYVTVNSKLTNIAGSLTFSYTTGEKYCFESTKNNYFDKDFCLDPIESPAYNVLMERESATNETVIDDDIVITVIGSDVRNNITSWVAVNFYSPEGSLTDYDLIISYNGSTDTQNGNTGTGSTLNSTMNINGSSYGDQLTVTTRYLSSNNLDYVTRTWFIEIKAYEVRTGSFDSWKAENTNLSPTMLAIIASIVILIIAGLAGTAGALVGQTGSLSLGAGVVASGMFAYLNWLPDWFFYTVALIGVMYIATRIAGGGN